MDVFSPGTREILQHLAWSAMPAGALVPSPGEGTIRRFEAFMAAQPRAAQVGMEALVRMVQHGARLGHGRPFTRLDADQKLAYLRGMLNGPYPLKQLLRVVLSPIKVSRYDDEALCARLEAPYQVEPPAAPEATPRYMELAMDAREAFDEDEEIEADVVVVGSGAGGAAIAAELASMGVATVILEEGDYFQRPDFNGRAVDILTRMYRDMGMTGTVGNCYIPVPMGVCVGGTTTVNSGTCYRPPARILDKWRREMGLASLTEEALQDDFSRVENVLQVTPADPKYVGGIGQVLARGCQALGWQEHGPLPRNAPDCDGQSLCVFGCPTDAKRSANVSYVPLALRYGANLLYNARVERLLTEGGRATGVVARARGGGHRITVRAGAVVLAAGTMMTPAMMLRWGLQNAHGQVGRHLSIHPAVGVMAMFDELIDGGRSIPQGYGIEDFHDEGLLFEGAFLPMDFGAGGVTLVGSRFTQIMERYRHMAYFGFLVEDTSRGRVLLAPGGRPVMTYYLNRHDVARIKRGTELLLQLYLAAGAKAIFPMVPGFEEIHDTTDVERFRRANLGARDFELTAHHPLCSCRMGVDERSSVVNERNEVHHVPGLYIADGSSLPSSPAVNPQITIMALATRAARSVAEAVG